MNHPRILVLPLAVILIVAAGCTKTYRSFSDEKVATTEIAHLRSNFKYRGLPGIVDTATGIQIWKFDDKVLPDSDYVTEIELLAGRHCANVVYTKDIGSVLGAIVLATGGMPGFYGTKEKG